MGSRGVGKTLGWPGSRGELGAACTSWSSFGSQPFHRVYASPWERACTGWPIAGAKGHGQGSGLWARQ